VKNGGAHSYQLSGRFITRLPSLAGLPHTGAMVGLLTSRLGLAGLLAVMTLNRRVAIRQWREEDANPSITREPTPSASFLSETPGYSGGAVPELHRSSLFVGEATRARTDHQRTMNQTARNLLPSPLGVKSLRRLLCALDPRRIEYRRTKAKELVHQQPSRIGNSRFGVAQPSSAANGYLPRNSANTSSHCRNPWLGRGWASSNTRRSSIGSTVTKSSVISPASSRIASRSSPKCSSRNK